MSEHPAYLAPIEADPEDDPGGSNEDTVPSRNLIYDISTQRLQEEEGVIERLAWCSAGSRETRYCRV